MKKNKSYNIESGVALLFALGLLSLLLVIGLGFFTNITIAQKIAVNSNNRSQAKILAQSALNRALMNIMIYQHNIFKTDSLKVSNFTSVFSQGEFDINDDTSAEKRISNDYLLGKESLLKYLNEQGEETNKQAIDFDFSQDEAKIKENAKKLPQWIYFYTKDEDTNSQKIIGRAAYRVIPTTTESRITINSVLSNVLPYDVHDTDKKNSTPWYDPSIKNGEVVGSLTPYEFRWGKEIDELALSEITMFDAAKIHTDNKEIITEPNVYYPTKWTKRADVSKTVDDVSQVYQLTEKDEISWLKKWFIDNTNKNPIANETFLASTKSLQFSKRFNIGFIPNELMYDEWNKDYDNQSPAFDNWYCRFGFPYSTNKEELKPNQQQNDNWNTAHIVHRIGSLAKTFRENDGCDSEIKDTGSGMHFLRRLCDNPASFVKIEHRRKQIVANLNDYCDSDNIPTSACSPHSGCSSDAIAPDGIIYSTQWALEADHGANKHIPVYTGNEQTPYINEVAIGIKLKNGKIEEDNVSIDVDTKLFAELVNIYPPKRLDGSWPFEGKYTFAGNIKGLKAKFKLKLHGTIKYSLNGETVEPPFDFKNLTKEDEDKLISEECEILKTSKKIKMNFSLPNETSNDHTGYYANYDEISSDIKIEWKNFKSTLTSFLPQGSTINSVQIEKVDIVLTEYTLDLGNMMLLGNHTTDTNASPNNPGVDYVNVRYKTDKIIKTNEEPLISGLNVNSDKITIPEDNKSIIFDAEVKDPRQNLNLVVFNEDNTDDKSTDWKIKKEINQHSLGSFNWHETPSNPIEELKGYKNQCSNPQTPGINYQFDKEFASDVAWLGKDTGKHISTAFIRNAPMWSPWELGAIHRGKAWQTINLKSAAPIESTDSLTSADMRLDVKWDDSTGTTYSGGDGALLEQIKMTNDSKSQGKIDIALLRDNATNYMNNEEKKAVDKNIFKALFNKIKIGNGYPTKEKAIQNGTTIVTLKEDTITKFFASDGENVSNEIRDNQNMRTDVLNWKINNGYWYNAFNSVNNDNLKNDAEQEEIIGRTINLLTCSPSLPNTIRLLVVAQSIKDIGGSNITKFSKKYSHPATVDCKIGQFDYAYIDEGGHSTKKDENITYFDEITGEVKMLVTIDRDPLTGKLTVRNIEYLE